MTDTRQKQLPPDPERMNGSRAKFADYAIAHFIDFTEVDREDALGDLLCNLMHLCDRDAELGGFDAQLERARRGYLLETTPDAVPVKPDDNALTA